MLVSSLDPQTNNAQNCSPQTVSLTLFPYLLLQVLFLFLFLFLFVVIVIVIFLVALPMNMKWAIPELRPEAGGGLCIRLASKSE
jgi:hypothetical protein